MIGAVADLQPVFELGTQHDLRQLVVAVEAAPGFLRSVDELEDHGERGGIRQAAFRADSAVAHGGERALDRVGNRYVICGRLDRLWIGL